MLTYNHEKYIRHALDSVLSQEINVSYEILIFDDASTDKTPAILREYKKKYPGIITLYMRKHNGNHPNRNFYYLLSKLKGKYWALLEGDDYWISTLKLKKQHECLEAHPEYSACVSDTESVGEDGTRLDDKDVAFKYERNSDGIYTMDDFRAGKRVGRAVSFFARNEFNKEEYKILYTANNMMGDYTLFMISAAHGFIYQMPEKLAASRIVRTQGKVNFNSIHINNSYRNYIGLCYYLRMEKHMMRYYGLDFESHHILEYFLSANHTLPFKAVVKLISISDRKRKTRYFKLFAMEYLRKCLLSSDFIADYAKRNNSPHCDSRRFGKEKKRIIIFGAGEGTREYLDKEWWRELPLFIVDNDKEKQGQSFKGYLIKSPEDILLLKDKVTVLITVKHGEREIAKQLEGMGIYNYYFYCGMQSERLRNRIANILKN
jgi:glycosyltransferase involved in cell wall biosynthesis